MYHRCVTDVSQMYHSGKAVEKWYDKIIYGKSNKSFLEFKSGG